MVGKNVNNPEIIELNPREVLLEITKKGYIKSLRKSDTGIGYTLETEIRILLRFLFLKESRANQFDPFITRIRENKNVYNMAR